MYMQLVALVQFVGWTFFLCMVLFGLCTYIKAR
jgi:hypothetical protein